MRSNIFLTTLCYGRWQDNLFHQEIMMIARQFLFTRSTKTLCAFLVLTAVIWNTGSVKANDTLSHSQTDPIESQSSHTPSDDTAIDQEHIQKKEDTEDSEDNQEIQDQQKSTEQRNQAFGIGNDAFGGVLS